MYLPYLRGKQFELIGLREISGLLSANSGKISPIIEPVKDSSTIKSTIKELIGKGINFTIIINPQVGTFRNTEKILEMLELVVGTSTNFQIGIIFNGKQDAAYLIEKLREHTNVVHGLTLIHNHAHDNIQTITEDLGNEFTIRFNVINFGKINRRYSRNFAPDTLVELDDYFNSQTKNSDYLQIGESAFSEEHLYYSDEGFIGFSDYLTVGENYSDSGFLPYAIAIHISYNTEGNIIKIKHFVSDSNDDSSDIAGKFDEAINKLVIWCDQTGYTSPAIDTFRELHENGHFPGLGTLKKLSIINHIALILSLI
jgi:hypothetical protein